MLYKCCFLQLDVVCQRFSPKVKLFYKVKFFSNEFVIFYDRLQLMNLLDRLVSFTDKWLLAIVYKKF